MDQSVHKVVRFDRFALDLTRGCLCSGDQEIDLPPKAFQVLTYLALNAGRLVPKEELHEAVWADVAVSDESLVQSIRQVRQKLGDRGHELIKTVPRRGYRLESPLDAQFLPSVPPMPEAAAVERPGDDRAGFGALLMHVGGGERDKRYMGAVAGGLVCVLAAVAYLIAPFPLPFAHTPVEAIRPAAALFTSDDATRVATVAASKQLPVPAFQIREPAHDVSNGIRRFLGIWVSDTGWMGSHRQLMLIVTQVDRDGMAIGYGVNGPPQPRDRLQKPAGPFPFTAHILGDVLSFQGGAGPHVASLTRNNRMELKLTYRDGHVAVVSLDPVWTLVEAQHAAAVSAASR